MNSMEGPKPGIRYRFDSILVLMHQKFGGYYRLFRYVISGGTSAFVTLSTLYILTKWFGVWYLLSTVIGFLVGFLVSFTLQKFWTFKDGRKDVLASQAFFYFIIVAGNLCLNALGMYVLVDIFHIWYMPADLLVLFLIAIESFFLYRIVFKKNN